MCLVVTGVDEQRATMLRPFGIRRRLKPKVDAKAKKKNSEQALHHEPALRHQLGKRPGLHCLLVQIRIKATESLLSLTDTIKERRI